MQHQHKSAIKCSLVSLAVSAVLFSNSAIAQTDTENTAQEGQYERIIVTASKREETLQDTPIAVSVTTDVDIEQAKVLDVIDLQTLVPSLTVSQTTLTSATSFSIRGFGSPSGIGTEPSVGVFIDGVFRSRAGGAISDLPKLERVEVLSGPQSTLFGKNASAGVVSIVTAAPSFASEGRIEATIGNYNQRLLRAYASGAVTDDLAMSIAGTINKRDGFTESLQPGVSDADDRNRWSLRGQALWQIDEDTSLRVIADHNSLDEICCTSPNVISGPIDNIVLALGGQLLDANDPFARESVLLKSPSNDMTDSGISAHLDIDFDGFALSSISAYRSNHLKASNPVGSSSVDTSTSVREITIDTFSQELRLSSTGDGDFNWIAGGFYFYEDIESEDALIYGPDLRNFVNILTGGALVGVEAALGFPSGTFYPEGLSVGYAEGLDNRDYSFFASGDYRLNEQLTATFGLNYTKDSKEAYVTELSNEDVFSAINFNTLAGGAFAGLSSAQFRPPIVSFPNSVEDGKSDDSDITYLARIAYKANQHFNFYISRATGFKSSSYDLTNSSRPARELEQALNAAGENSPNPRYGSRLSTPEFSTVTELGMKVWYQRFQANVAIFDQSLEDFQVRSFDGTDFFQGNAGKTSVDGVEFDLRFALNKHLSFSLAGTLLDPIFDDFKNAPPGPLTERDELGRPIPEDLSGTRPLNIHDKTLVAGIVYNQSLDIGDLYLRADYTYQSNLVFAPAGSITGTNPDFSRQVNNLGASAGLFFGNGMSVQVWGRNLTNDENLLSVFGQAGQPGTAGAWINQPRTFGLSVAYEF